MRQKIITKRGSLFITKCVVFITLQNAAGITKRVDYYKMRHNNSNVLKEKWSKD